MARGLETLAGDHRSFVEITVRVTYTSRLQARYCKGRVECSASIKRGHLLVFFFFASKTVIYVVSDLPETVEIFVFAR